MSEPLPISKIFINEPVPEYAQARSRVRNNNAFATQYRLAVEQFKNGSIGGLLNGTAMTGSSPYNQALGQNYQTLPTNPSAPSTFPTTSTPQQVLAQLLGLTIEYEVSVRTGKRLKSDKVIGVSEKADGVYCQLQNGDEVKVIFQKQ